MNRACTALAGRRTWLAAGSMSLALLGAVAQQLVPTAADAAPRVTAAAAVAPIVLPPAAPEHVLGPAAPDVPAAAAPPATPSPAVTRIPTVTSTPALTAPAKAVPTRIIKQTPPRAVSADVCSGPGWQARRGQQALSSLRDTGQRSGVSVSFLPAKSGYLGLTYPARHHVDVFVRSCSAESAALLRHVVSHEMGHAYDAEHMTAASRAAYLAMRGIPAGTPWFGCSYCTDFNTPAGDFAETYSQWQRSARDSRTQIAPVPGPAALAAVAAAFFSA